MMLGPAVRTQEQQGEGRHPEASDENPEQWHCGHQKRSAEGSRCRPWHGPIPSTSFSLGESEELASGKPHPDLLPEKQPQGLQGLASVSLAGLG